MNAGPATTVLPALNPTLAARLFPNADHGSPEQQPPRRVWSLPENCVPQLQGAAASRPPPQGFVAVAKPLTSTSAGPSDDQRAVLLVDPTLSPPIRVVRLFFNFLIFFLRILLFILNIYITTNYKLFIFMYNFASGGLRYECGGRGLRGGRAA
jgi:hypothetical protein